MKLRFIQSDYNHSVFISVDHDMTIVIYINDILIFRNNDKKMKRVQDSLAKRFKMTNLGEVSHYLGMEIDIGKERTTIRQTTYLRKTLEKFGFNSCKPCKIPMDPGTVSHVEGSKEQADEDTNKVVPISSQVANVGSDDDEAWPCLLNVLTQSLSE